jgi:polyhydroxybutyrate depolymerase
MQPGERIDGTIESSGGTREYTIVVPASYRTPGPLLLDFHGHGGTARSALKQHGFVPLAEQHGFVLVAPTGVIQNDGLHGWSTGAASRDSGTVDDVAFVGDLIDEVTRLACIDTSRVWAAGHSNGGGMVTRLACRMPQRIAAFASVAGAVYDDACLPGGAKPFLQIHGLADQVVPYEGKATRAVRAVIDDRAAMNGCTNPTDPADAPIADSIAFRQTWTCPAGAPVVHIRIPEHGHQWPAAPMLDTARVIYEFLSGAR